MVRISVLNDALKNMFNAEKRGKRQVLIRPSSKVVIKFLSVMQKHGKRHAPRTPSAVPLPSFATPFASSFSPSTFRIAFRVGVSFSTLESGID
jgi:hypothetical protein